MYLVAAVTPYQCVVVHQSGALAEGVNDVKEFETLPARRVEADGSTARDVLCTRNVLSIAMYPSHHL